MKLIWKLAIPQICIVFCLGVISFLAINYAMNTRAVSVPARTAAIILALMLAGMAIASTFALLLQLRILVIKPLNMIKAKIRDIAEDRADLHENIPCDQNDEIGELAKWFNSLTTKLAGILSERQAMLGKLHTESGKFREMAHWYSSILDSMPFPISVQDSDMKWTFINTALEELLGKKREDVIGLPCCNWKMSICNTEDCGIACAKLGLRQTQFSCNDSSYQVTVQILRGLNNKTTGYIEVVQDITLLEELVEQQAKVNAANEAISIFLANMSNEIRTPVDAIVSMTSIGMSSSETTQMKYCFSKIEDEVMNLLGIIGEILEMSKIEES